MSTVEENKQPRYCSKCRKTMAAVNFYTFKNGEKSDLCKSCETLHIDNYDPSTFVWLLQKYDVPYVPEEWNVLRDRAYQKDPYKVNGTSVFGKYLAKMRLKKWKDFGYADSEALQKEAREKAEKYGTPQEQTEKKIAEMEEAYKKGEISEAQYLTYKEINEPKAIEFVEVNGSVTTTGPNKGGNGPYPTNDHPFEQVDIPDVSKDLTDDDKVYLAMKWGRLYSAADWVYLEQKYKEYDDSFDLHNADLISGTKQLCKLDLKCNQALDCGDIDSYSKLARASDSLRKSLKFTAAQRKEDKEQEFSCYGQIVAFAEKFNDEDCIRPIDLSIDRDIVDKDIQDMKNFNKSLIEEDPTVYKMIEQYIKKREILAQQEADAKSGKAMKMSDRDLVEYRRKQEEERLADLKKVGDKVK